MRSGLFSPSVPSESNPGLTRNIGLVMVAPIAFVLAVLLLACSDGGPSPGLAEPSDETPSVTVEIFTVQPTEIRWEVGLTGQINARYLVDISPEIKGVVRSIEFEEGGAVAEGDVLFELRNEEQEARLREARARTALAQDVFDREQRLGREDISSSARRAEAKSALDQTRAELDLARLQVERTRIRAPFDGVMSDTDIGPGAWVEQEMHLARIAAIDDVEVLFTTTEQGSAIARIGAPIVVRVAAYPDERFEGEVFYISPTIDPATRRLILKARIANADHRLKPGMFANVDVVISIKESGLVVPEAAMVYDRSGIYVWRVGGDGLAEKVPVEIGLRQHGIVEITAGLEFGDRVVSAGVHKVMAGHRLEAAEPVAVRDEAALPAGSPRADG